MVATVLTFRAGASGDSLLAMMPVAGLFAIGIGLREWLAHLAEASLAQDLSRVNAELEKLHAGLHEQVQFREQAEVRLRESESRLRDRPEAGLAEHLIRANTELRKVNTALQEQIGHYEQAQAQLRESELRFRTVCDSAPAMIWTAELNGRCTWFNRAWLDFTGRTMAAELEGGWEEDVHPNDREQCLQAYAQALTARKAINLEYRLRRSDGSYRWILDRIAPRFAGNGSHLGFVGTAVDITDRKDAEARTQQLAYLDTLTGLPNRALLRDRMDKAIAHAARNSLEMAVLYIDLDRIKAVNDSLGHAAGDQVLREAARRLSAALREGDTVARVGGDEYVILLSQIRNVGDANHVAEKILDVLGDPVLFNGHEVHVTGSIGVSLYPQDGRDAETLTKQADAALYRAKEAGRNTYRVFSSAISPLVREQATLENLLRSALDRQEFVLRYQPQVDLGSGTMIGAEALLRWRHPERGLIAPADFLFGAERAGLVVSLRHWVLRTACKDAQTWRRPGVPLRIAVNLSTREFAEGDLVEQIERILREVGLPAERLDLEVTETAVMRNIEYSIATLDRLKALGVQLTLDDFGTGSSNLGYLMRCPFDRLKIDRMLIQEVATSRRGRAIVEAMLNMARILGLQVIAQGVAKAEQRDVLKVLNCEAIQGYLVTRPLPSEDLMSMQGMD
ncbi:MAG: putative bifunctional diguanylate cyclase/phosphodiesterase [Gammaproteobacteria bacterium]